MATVAEVIMAAGAFCGCSAFPVPTPYDASGRVAGGRVPAGPYGGVNFYGPAVDLAACARSPEQPNRIDQLCNRQDGNPFGSNSSQPPRPAARARRYLIVRPFGPPDQSALP